MNPHQAKLEPSEGKTFFGIIIFIAIYLCLIKWMFYERDAEFNKQQQYIQDHYCKLVEVIPSRPVGMMIHGETDIYECPNGEKVRVN